MHYQFHDQFKEETSRIKKFKALAMQMPHLPACTFSLRFLDDYFLVVSDFCASNCVSNPLLLLSRESVHGTSSQKVLEIEVERAEMADVNRPAQAITNM
jgi:hypothetical protein